MSDTGDVDKQPAPPEEKLTILQRIDLIHEYSELDHMERVALLQVSCPDLSVGVEETFTLIEPNIHALHRMR